MSVKHQVRSRVTVANPELKAELDSHLGALRDLGRAYSDTIAESFLARIDTLIDLKIEARLERGGPTAERSGKAGDHASIWSMIAIQALAIPLTAVAGFWGVIVV